MQDKLVNFKAGDWRLAVSMVRSTRTCFGQFFHCLWTFFTVQISGRYHDGLV